MFVHVGQGATTRAPAGKASSAQDEAIRCSAVESSSRLARLFKRSVRAMITSCTKAPRVSTALSVRSGQCSMLSLEGNTRQQQQVVKPTGPC